MKQFFSMILVFLMTFLFTTACEPDKIPNGDFSDVTTSEEQSFDASETVSEEASMVTSEDLSEDESSESSKDESSESSKDESSESSKDESEESSKDESSESSKDESEESSKDESSESSKDESSETSKDESSESSKDESEESSKDESSESSKDESSESSKDESNESSKDESNESSKDESEESQEPSEEPSEEISEDIIDVEGYEQFLKVSAIDGTLADRGFKDIGANRDYQPLNYDVIKACWISQFDFDSVYCSSRKQRSKSDFTSLVEKAYDNLLTLGFNTVIVQVRPNTDSFYPSAYYPWSSYVVYRYGKYGSYDPISIMIEEAHERGLSFHAWINPMRGMSSTNLGRVADEYLMTEWVGTRKLYTYNSLYYLNIAYEDVRKLIINGAAEIVRNYDVDGVHMDDYFYFGETADFDNVEYNNAKATNSRLTLQQFRYNNLNTLVSGIYSAIKTENSKVLFGISPAGNLNSMSTTYYADVRTWLSQDGYVDYIMPQIYFGMEHQTWSFSATYERWSAITTNPNIKFTCGMTFSKAISGYDGTGDQYAGSGKNEWINNKDVFKKCFEYALKQDNFGGYAIFCYQYMFDPNTGAANTKINPELENCKKYMTDIIKGEVIKY